MIIKSIHVQNFCGLLETNLYCDSLTALVGGNGCGKSTFLRALELFYSRAPRVSPQDFFANDTNREIRIGVTYGALGERAEALFRHYMDGDSLTVTRIITLVDGKVSAKFHGTKLQNQAFLPIRNAATKMEARQIYNDLRLRSEFVELPPASSTEKVHEAITQFEVNHPELNIRQDDDGQFFGFTEVAQGYLGRFTRLLLIPALRDAEGDSLDGRGSVITALMDMVVRNRLAERQELVDLKREFQERYSELIARENLPELDLMQYELTSTLRTFIADSSVEIEWAAPGEVSFPTPRAEVRLAEHGYYSSVANSGHGLQRTFVLSMLQQLAREQSNRITDNNPELEDIPNLVLCIEEPELYQHPIRARNFAKVLSDIASGAIPGVANTTQVIYTTHSPYFVGIDRFHQIRVFQKLDNGPDSPRVTRVTQVTKVAVAQRIGEIHNPGRDEQRNTWESIRAKLHTIMSPIINEGFFSDTVVLVEGEEDRGALLGTALVLGHDLEAEGVSVIPCGGKANIDRPLIIFRQFGIKTFVLWDSDSDKEQGATVNHRLLRLVNQPVVDYPPTQIRQMFACFEQRLHRTLLEELGERKYSDISQACHQEQQQEIYGDETKNPLVIAQILQKAADQNIHCATLEHIVRNILEIKNMSGVEYFNAVAALEEVEIALAGD